MFFQVYAIAKEDFNYDYPNSQDLLSPYVASFYEAVMLYAKALNESLAEKNLNSFPNGSEILKHLWNTTQGNFN